MVMSAPSIQFFREAKARFTQVFISSSGFFHTHTGAPLQNPQPQGETSHD
jgi:hypothetical protein